MEKTYPVFCWASLRTPPYVGNAKGNNSVLEARPFNRYGVYGGSSNRKARDIRTNQDRLGRGPIAYPSIIASNIIEGGTTQDGNYFPPDTSKCPKVNYDCHPTCRKRDSAGCNICDCGTSQGSSHSSSYQSSGSKDSASSKYCFAMVICMLSCKDGYTLGERDSEEGCQTCHCMKTNSAASHAQSNGNVNEHAGDGQDAASGSNYGSFDGDNGGITSGSATGSSGYGGYSDGSGERSSISSGYSSASGFDKGTGGSGFDGVVSSNSAGFGGMQGFAGSASGGVLTWRKF
ncbi:hypothetical protein CHS0354_008540 [Potamilus streckersoni]|uniref:Uncharacterized protein n=1 Tax=Potamilus streckersoni TaxID=2493646 RepID=A0AAE0S7V2_9BIVA|nr:hypothetical protein CHS0354_008540 [Potamilus streckersoni]